MRYRRLVGCPPALFELLGSPMDRKRHVIEDGGHSVPQDELIAETLGWFDRHLGWIR